MIFNLINGDLRQIIGGRFIYKDIILFYEILIKLRNKYIRLDYNPI
jgi:hypothetical protein